VQYKYGKYDDKYGKYDDKYGKYDDKYGKYDEVRDIDCDAYLNSVELGRNDSRFSDCQGIWTTQKSGWRPACAVLGLYYCATSCQFPGEAMWLLSTLTYLHYKSGNQHQQKHYSHAWKWHGG